MDWVDDYSATTLRNCVRTGELKLSKPIWMMCNSLRPVYYLYSLLQIYYIYTDLQFELVTKEIHAENSAISQIV
jgi:hypothetical protein